MALRSTFRLGLTALSFWPFLPIASRAPIYGRLIFELAIDKRVPWSRKVILGFAVAYVVSPIDLIPDFIPFISRVDDVMVTIIALDLFLEGVPRELMIEKMYTLGIDGRELERDMEAARRFLPLPIRALARRLPVLMEASADVVKAELEARGFIETEETAYPTAVYMPSVTLMTSRRNSALRALRSLVASVSSAGAAEARHPTRTQAQRTV